MSGIAPAAGPADKPPQSLNDALRFSNLAGRTAGKPVVATPEKVYGNNNDAEKEVFVVKRAIAPSKNHTFVCPHCGLQRRRRT
jgi:hypothetical protein